MYPNVGFAECDLSHGEDAMGDLLGDEVLNQDIEYLFWWLVRVQVFRVLDGDVDIAIADFGRHSGAQHQYSGN